MYSTKNFSKIGDPAHAQHHYFSLFLLGTSIEPVDYLSTLCPPRNFSRKRSPSAEETHPKPSWRGHLLPDTWTSLAGTPSTTQRRRTQNIRHMHKKMDDCLEEVTKTCQSSSSKVPWGVHVSVYRRINASSPFQRCRMCFSQSLHRVRFRCVPEIIKKSDVSFNSG